MAKVAGKKLIVPAVILKDIPAIGQYWPGQGGVRVGEAVNDEGQVIGYLVTASKPDGELITVRGSYGTRSKEIGAGSYRDSVANTAKMLKAGSPAAKAVAAVKSDGHEFSVASQCHVNLIRANLPKQTKDIGWVLSSTEFSAHCAWCQGFRDGGQSIDYKVYEYVVFPVRVVPISP